MDKKERYYMSSVRLGPKGQIVIPKVFAALPDGEDEEAEDE